VAEKGARDGAIFEAPAKASALSTMLCPQLMLSRGCVLNT
jgi:hypothetical protein